MKKSYYVLLLGIAALCLLPTAYWCWAADPGTTGANFLKIGVGARSIAMGETSAAISRDANSAYWNPAGLAQVECQEISFMYNKWFEGINQQFLAYAHPYKRLGTFGLSIYRLGMDSIQGYDSQKKEIGKIGASDLSIGISFAREFIPSARAGVTLKWIYEKLHNVPANAFALDLGLQYSCLRADTHRQAGFPLEGLSFGTALTNFGTGLKFDVDRAKLPLSLKIGSGYTRNILGSPATVAVDLFIPYDNDVSFATGLEFWAKNLLALRFGYKTKDSEGNGIRAGFGIKVKFVQLDYAYAGYGEFGATHRFGISIKNER